ADVKDASVYGTVSGFRGKAVPGRSLFIDAAWEYSVRRSWVLALDATFEHHGATRIIGFNILGFHNAHSPTLIEQDSGSSDAFGLAPAVEYSWRRNIGVIMGVRVIPVGRNAAATITPAVAINYVR